MHDQVATIFSMIWRQSYFIYVRGESIKWHFSYLYFLQKLSNFLGEILYIFLLMHTVIAHMDFIAL